MTPLSLKWIFQKDFFYQKTKIKIVKKSNLYNKIYLKSQHEADSRSNTFLTYIKGFDCPRVAFQCAQIRARHYNKMNACDTRIKAIKSIQKWIGRKGKKEEGGKLFSKVTAWPCQGLFYLGPDHWFDSVLL